ncbi:MAG TPA: sugar phosphate isomerase/epimerase family protein [Lichenihabitans sp.]|jgi:sugar phosphate isomerase/epimerase|nr:sugar phosphate isomerase/epimerase family protein [Lichenihabitans sp.]
MFAMGLNPYGLTYHLGLQGQGTPRANPKTRGLDGFLAIAEELGVVTIEIFEPWIAALDDRGLTALRNRLVRNGMQAVISSGLPSASMPSILRSAAALDAKLVRFALTRVLCGDRATLGDGWPKLVEEVRGKLKAAASVASEHGLTLVIENHQDFGSDELVGFCEEAGPNVGICFDTGNAFPVAEAPLDFTRRVAAHVRHVHLKDYRVQCSDEGFRLVRCAIGDGAVPFRAMAEILLAARPSLTAVLEPGALEARHVRLLRPEWWRFYAPKTAASLAACLGAARINLLPEGADTRTPWETGEDGQALVAYELDMIRRSAANMRKLGVMSGQAK